MAISYWILFSFCLGFASQIADAQSRAQRAVLYSGRDQTGRFIVIDAKHIPDLKTVNFDNLARSACVTGTWLFYDKPNYNRGSPDAAAEWLKASNGCFNLAFTPDLVSSVSYGGYGDNHDQDSFSLYEQINFGGNQEFIFADAATLKTITRSASLIITGGSSWTVYDETNYRGQSICITPVRDSTPVFSALVKDISTEPELKIPYNSIKSVKKGCFGKIAKLGSQ